MKKIIAAVFALCIVGGSYPELYRSAHNIAFTANAADSEEIVKDTLTYCVYSDHAEVSECSYKADGEITILSEINGVPVTQIHENAFQNCVKITKVTIPESVTLIGDNAFEGCTSMTSVVLGESLKFIGICAFKDCSSLEEFSNALPITNGNVISGCTSLRSFAVADNGEQIVIKHLKFDNCKNLESIVISENCVLENSFTLSGCSSIKKISLPKNTQLDELIVNDCDELLEIKLPETYAENAVICIADCNKTASLSITSETFVDLSIENMPVLEKLSLNGSQKINFTISKCEKLNGITRFLGFPSEIDYTSCPSLKDIYYYEETSEKCHIPDVELLAQNGITVHLRSSNISLQNYLESNNVSFTFIDDEPIMGDANCDGNVSLADAVAIMQSLANPDKYALSAQGKINGDVSGNNDGITNNDALTIQRQLLGLS